MFSINQNHFCAAGWTKYERIDDVITISTVDYPQDDALILDVEVCVNAGPFPTIAIAASPHAWYAYGFFYTCQCICRRKPDKSFTKNGWWIMVITALP